MRSCKYLKTNVKESDRRTKIITAKNISFKYKGKMIDLKSKNLERVDMVMITFKFQKNDWRRKSVHMFGTEDNILCSVKAWERTIKRLRKTIKNFNKNIQVCVFNLGDQIIKIKGDMVCTVRNVDIWVHMKI